MGRAEEMRVDGRGDGKIMLVPPMEPYCARLTTAVFRSIGYNAHVLPENDATLAIGLKHTAGGECVPCPTTVGALIGWIEAHKADPKDVIFFMPTACGPCRFGQYAKLDTIILEKLGWGGVQILSPTAENAYGGIPIQARKRMWHSMVMGDIMRKLACRVRPYEAVRGETDTVIEKWMQRLEEEFAKEDISGVDALVREAVAEVKAIRQTGEVRPLVGIVGEIYVRCDPFINNNLIRCIEELGGEAWLSPLSEWVLYTGHMRGVMADEERTGVGRWIEKAWAWAEKSLLLEKVEHHYTELADPVLHDRREPDVKEVMKEGETFLPWQYQGEAILTLGRAALFVTRDGARAVVNASPMFCMPGTITTSIFPELEKELGVPVVCNFYDGSGDPNKSLVPVMHYLVEEARRAAAASTPTTG